MKLKNTVVYVALSLLSSCASVETNFNSKVTGSVPENIQDVLIVTSIDKDIFISRRISGLEEGLKEAFQSCGVKAVIERYNKLSLEKEININEAYNNVMLLSSGEGQFRVSNITTGTLYFNASFKNSKNKDFNWRSKFSFALTNSGFENFEAQGKNIAINIVEQLKKDGVLRSCSSLRSK